MPPQFEDLPEGFCVTGPGGRILYMNPAAEKLLDFSASQAGEASLCERLCSRLRSPSGADCASVCPLRADPVRKATAAFEGFFGPTEAFEWHDGAVQKVERWRVLRVRCLMAEDDRRVTFVELAPEAPDGRNVAN